MKSDAIYTISPIRYRDVKVSRVKRKIVDFYHEKIFPTVKALKKEGKIKYYLRWREYFEKNIQEFDSEFVINFRKWEKYDSMLRKTYERGIPFPPMDQLYFNSKTAAISTAVDFDDECGQYPWLKIRTVHLVDGNLYGKGVSVPETWMRLTSELQEDGTQCWFYVVDNNPPAYIRFPHF